jgi:hypothetical protein
MMPFNCALTLPCITVLSVLCTSLFAASTQLEHAKTKEDRNSCARSCLSAPQHCSASLLQVAERLFCARLFLLQAARALHQAQQLDQLERCLWAPLQVCVCVGGWVGGCVC